MFLSVLAKRSSGLHASVCCGLGAFPSSQTNINVRRTLYSHNGSILTTTKSDTNPLQNNREHCRLYRLKHRVYTAAQKSFSSSVNPDEMRTFGEMAKDWMDPNGPMKALHAMNEVRIPWIREAVAGSGKLSGLTVIDVGCGAGILTEPLSRLGAASVTGLDASEACIDAAKARKDGSTAEYINTTVEDYLAERGPAIADVVVASEVVEHVELPSQFVRNCIQLLKPGGHLFLTTINRTMLSQVGAIYIAENLMGLVPPGTHTWSKFITPDELSLMVEYDGGGGQNSGSASVKSIQGMTYCPYLNRWYWFPNKSINYALHAVKN